MERGLGSLFSSIRSRHYPDYDMFMPPYTIRCTTCGKYIHKGEATDVEESLGFGRQAYMGIQVFEFSMNCPYCSGSIKFESDPENAVYVLVWGASRNFQLTGAAAGEETKALEDDKKNYTMKNISFQPFIRNQQYRHMIPPYKIRCTTCCEYIHCAKITYFRQEDVQNEDEYLRIPVRRFFIRCTHCLAQIIFKTYPENYRCVIECGASRNFETFKLTEAATGEKTKAIEDDEINNSMKKKEKLISSLKDGNNKNDSHEKSDSSFALRNVVVDSIKHERDLVKEELRRSNELIKNCRYEVQKLGKLSQHNLAIEQEQYKILKEQLDMEIIQCEELQLLNSQLKEEFDLLRDDLAATKNSFKSRIQDREIEIEKLRRQEFDLSRDDLAATKNSFSSRIQDRKIEIVKLRRQTKEKLISSLKEGNIENDSHEKSDSSSALLNAEVDSIKQERDFLKEELRRSNELIRNYHYEAQELEKSSQHDLATAQERCKILKMLLDMEKIQREELQLLNSRLKEEFDLLRDDLAATKNSFKSRIQDREIEIEKLRRQLTTKSLSTVSQDESRLHSLTENLIQKQTVVEALSTEKNFLVLQLERLELEKYEPPTTTATTQEEKGA